MSIWMYIKLAKQAQQLRATATSLGCLIAIVSGSITKKPPASHLHQAALLAWQTGSVSSLSPPGLVSLLASGIAGLNGHVTVLP